jgi:leader peptidase (prepilin peptidase)/N-methyltransferase
MLGAVAGWFGWFVLALAAVLPFFIGGFIGLVLIVARRATRKSALPFGPSMIVGTLIVLTWVRLTGA